MSCQLICYSDPKHSKYILRNNISIKLVLVLRIKSKIIIIKIGSIINISDPSMCHVVIVALGGPCENIKKNIKIIEQKDSTTKITPFKRCAVVDLSS